MQTQQKNSIFVRNSDINPIVSETNPARKDVIYFALTTSKGWCIPDDNPWSTTLHIAIHPAMCQYNDIITCSEWQMEQRIIDSVDLPDNYLLNLVRLSSDEAFLSIKEERVHTFEVYDGGSDTIEYHINGLHRSLWCYFMDVIDGDPIILNPEKEGDPLLSFETGIEGTSELTGPPVAFYYR